MWHTIVDKNSHLINEWHLHPSLQPKFPDIHLIDFCHVPFISGPWICSASPCPQVPLAWTPTSLPCIHLDLSFRAWPQCFFLQSENHAGLQAASFCKFRTPCPILYSVIYPLPCFLDISLSSKFSCKSHTGQIFSVSSMVPGMVPVSWTDHQCVWVVGFSSLFYRTYLARNT